MTEQQLAEEIINYGHTGRIDPRVRKDPQLMSTIGRDLFRQHAVEPARISTHLSDRAGALERAAGPGGTVSQLETPADIAPKKGRTHGAVRGHATAEEMLRRNERWETPLRSGTIRERTGQLVLQASEREARQMTDKLVNDPATLERVLIARIRRDVLGRTS